MKTMTAGQYYAMLSDEIAKINEAAAVSRPSFGELRIIKPDPTLDWLYTARASHKTPFCFDWRHYAFFWVIVDCIAIALMIHSKVAR